MTVRPLVAVFDRHWGLLGHAFSAGISVEQMATLPPEVLDQINASIAVALLGSVERALAMIGHICMVEWDDDGGPADTAALTALCRQAPGREGELIMTRRDLAMLLVFAAVGFLIGDLIRSLGWWPW